MAENTGCQVSGFGIGFRFHCSGFRIGVVVGSAEKPSVHPSRAWTNGGALEIIGDCPFMLSPDEAFLGFFSRIVLEA
jgi:hypothetical protein